MRSTKIVATVGPACDSYEMLETLANAGVNVFRLNFSHGNHESHGEVIKRIRRLNKKLASPIPIMLDTKGPEIRSGDLKAPRELKKGEIIILTTDHVTPEDPERIGVNYDAFIHDIAEGEKILVDNGTMNLKIQKIEGKNVHCEVLDGGTLGSRRHLNLPGRDVSLEPITERDWADIAFGVEMGVDFIALSFVRRANEIYELKKFLKERSAHAQIIAKIESFEATRHLGTICEAADGLMVARGDLGAEVPFARVPQLQREMIETAAQYHKPVIVATHMLESMIENPMPTRAEVSDVANAVWQLADATMLSGESAGGKYPLKSVETMATVAQETENASDKAAWLRDMPCDNDRSALAKAACRLAINIPDTEAIVVITRSGFMASTVAAFRPKVPILAFTNTPHVRRQLRLIRGTHSYRIEFSSDPERTVRRAVEGLLKAESEWIGKKYILVADTLVDGHMTPMLQIRTFHPDAGQAGKV